MRAAAEKHEAEVRGLREELAQAERKMNEAERKMIDLLGKQARDQERLREFEDARKAEAVVVTGGGYDVGDAGNPRTQDNPTNVRRGNKAAAEGSAADLLRVGSGPTGSTSVEHALRENRSGGLTETHPQSVYSASLPGGNASVDGTNGGGETKGEAGRASSLGGIGEEHNSNPSLSQRERRKSIVGTRIPSTLESRILMVQGLVRSVLRMK
jgi:hypothetical protein